VDVADFPASLVSVHGSCFAAYLSNPSQPSPCAPISPGFLTIAIGFLMVGSIGILISGNESGANVLLVYAMPTCGLILGLSDWTLSLQRKKKGATSR
jgi:hypothetical protein